MVNTAKSPNPKNHQKKRSSSLSSAAAAATSFSSSSHSSSHHKIQKGTTFPNINFVAAPACDGKIYRYTALVRNRAITGKDVLKHPVEIGMDSSLAPFMKKRVQDACALQKVVQMDTLVASTKKSHHTKNKKK